MSRQFYTYIHCRPDGTPFYVGKGSGRRSHEFKCGRNPYYRAIIAKYGPENILVEVFHCASELDAFTDEIARISQLRGEGYELVNFTDGGEGPSGRVASAETRARISAVQTGRKMSPETLEKRSATVRGSKRSEETRARISAALRGKRLSLEHRAKLSAANLGKTHTPEARAKIAAAHTGQQRALGYRHTPEALAKIAAASKAMKRTPEHYAKVAEALRARAG